MESKEKTVLKLLAECERYDLSGTGFVKSLPLDQVISAYNGIGPESFPDRLRRTIDNLNPKLRCIALIHDCRFTFGDGTKEDFTAANRELKRNGKTVAEALYKWYNPLRYYTIAKSYSYASLCQQLGWTVYCEACGKTKNRMSETTPQPQPPTNQ